MNRRIIVYLIILLSLGETTVAGSTPSTWYNIYEQLGMHDGQAIGFYLTKGTGNLILNCDAYNNHDSLSENGRGGNTDGFGCHPRSAADSNNVFRGCRAWFNSDDGYDCINGFTATVFDHCWAFPRAAAN